MPFSPSDLAWWGWLLCALGAVAVAFCFGIIEGLPGTVWNRFVKAVMYCFLLVAALCVLVGVIRSIKWVWEG